jgi:hypothetical protein
MGGLGMASLSNCLGIAYASCAARLNMVSDLCKYRCAIVGFNQEGNIPGLRVVTRNLERSLIVRCHHLLKTFWHGWSDRQLADGTVVVTAPTWHTYITRPGSSLYFPTWAAHTPAPPSTPTTPSAHRTLMMPKRKRTRTQTRADRIGAERALNDAELNEPPPF